MTKKNIFVIGADEYNLDLIRKIPAAKEWELISVLSKDDVLPPEGEVEFDELYNQAKRVIDAYGHPPDAIIGYLDFPVMALVTLLQRDYDLPGPTPESAAKLEHKYWMRLEQKKVFPKTTPDFTAINPFAPEEARKNIPAYPFWLKPVVGHSSILGFMIEDENDLEQALHSCRQKIHLMGQPFNEFLRYIDCPSEIQEVDGNYCVAESLISASRQFTLEGFICNGEVVLYGAVDSMRGGQYNSSFDSYRYPADLPDELFLKSQEVIEKVLKQTGYDNAPFNVEFFWDPETDVLNLLEINTRISKSHSPLFHMVDGASHHKITIDLAMGKYPELSKRKGKDNVAAKFMLRSFESDGVIKRLPSNDEIENLKRILPDVDVNVLVKKNTKLSSLQYQDSYSYELAEVFLGGVDEGMLEDAYARCVDSLQIWIKPLPRKS